MDDLVITRHAKQRAEERGGTLEDLRRAPGARGAGGAVLKGHTVVTFLPRARLPVAVSGGMGGGDGRELPKELFSTAPSGTAPADSASVDVAGCEGLVVGAKGHEVIAMSRKYGVHISVGSNGRALVWGGSFDDVSRAVSAIEGIVAGRRGRHVSTAAAGGGGNDTAGGSGHDGAGASCVDIAGCEGYVIGAQHSVIDSVMSEFGVDISVRNGRATILGSGNTAGAKAAIVRLAAKCRLLNAVAAAEAPGANAATTAILVSSAEADLKKAQEDLHAARVLAHASARAAANIAADREYALARGVAALETARQRAAAADSAVMTATKAVEDGMSALILSSELDDARHWGRRLKTQVGLHSMLAERVLAQKKAAETLSTLLLAQQSPHLSISHGSAAACSDATTDASASFPVSSGPSVAASPATMPSPPPPMPASDKSCGKCGGPIFIGEGRRCGGCDTVVYCSLSHAISHWPEHREVCLAVQEPPPTLPTSPFARITPAVLWAWGLRSEALGLPGSPPPTLPPAREDSMPPAQFDLGQLETAAEKLSDSARSAAKGAASSAKHYLAMVAQRGAHAAAGMAPTTSAEHASFDEAREAAKNSADAASQVAVCAVREAIAAKIDLRVAAKAEYRRQQYLTFIKKRGL